MALALDEKTIIEYHKLIYELYQNIWLLEVSSMDNGVMKDTTRNEIDTIEIIGDRKKLIMAEVSKLANVKQSTMTVMINKLVDKQFVERARDESDRRIVTVELTDKGKQAYREHKKIHEKITKFWLDALAQKEKESLLKMMEKISDYMDA